MHNHEETQRKNRRNTGRVILLHVGVLAAFFVMAAWIWHCPIRLLFGVPCPGCGTTRACLSVLKLKIPEAFAYQPVFFLNVLLFLYGIHRNIIRRYAVKKGLRWSDKAETAVLVLVIAVILIVYVIRLIRQDSPVMELSPEKGLVFRVAELIRDEFSVIGNFFFVVFEAPDFCDEDADQDTANGHQEIGGKHVKPVVKPVRGKSICVDPGEPQVA